MASHEKVHPDAEADVSPSISSAVAVDSSTSAVNTPRDQSRAAVSRYLKDKEEEWNKVPERTGPLNLLELPVDILRLIVKEACLLPLSYRALDSGYTNTGDFRLPIPTTSPRSPSRTPLCTTSPSHTYTPDSISSGPTAMWLSTTPRASMP